MNTIRRLPLFWVASLEPKRVSPRKIVHAAMARSTDKLFSRTAGSARHAGPRGVSWRRLDYLRDSRSRSEVVNCGDRSSWTTRHDHERVVTSPLPDLRSTPPLAVAPLPLDGCQRRRATCPSPRGRATTQNEPEAPPGLRPSRARRADPTATQSAALPQPGHCGHDPALTPPADQ